MKHEKIVGLESFIEEYREPVKEAEKPKDNGE